MNQKLHARLAASCFCIIVVAAVARNAMAQTALPQSRPERTNYEETSTYADVVTFFEVLQRQTPLIRMTSFGKTNEGRDLPLAVIANPPVATPREALASGKPIVFVMANIHAGEVEGKESLQHLARRLTLGDLRPMTDKLVILYAPIYNADGNEKIALVARSRQNGPIGGVGVRENAQGLDLNRDYTKLESPEARALVELFSEWDPHMTVDLHTTNGDYHSYHLTYSIPLNPSIDPRLASYHRDTLMPAIAKAMLERHKLRTYYYGNIASPDGRGGGPRASGRGRSGARGEPTADDGKRGDHKSAEAPPAATANEAPRLRQWRAFSHLPRVGQNYVGFRNRLTILSEAYSYLDYKGRIDTTAAFVEEIMRYMVEHADEIRALTRQADNDLLQSALSGTLPRVGVEYEQRPLPAPVEILIGEVTEVINPRSQRSMRAMVLDSVTPERMHDYGIFVALRHVEMPQAYVFPPDNGLKVVVEKLRAHGIVVEKLTQPLKAEARYFRISNVNTAARAFEGHNETSLVGAFDAEETEFPVGTIIVRTGQPLGRLAAYLLEPESDDSLTSWNFLDAQLAPGKVFPIRKLMKPVVAASRVLMD